ncbi:hypothetical protein LINPERHAP2_LOCUS4602 [Linum perenne]
MKHILEFLWARTGPIQVSDLANNFFLVRFTHEKDYSAAAFGGPWKVAVKRIGDFIGKTVRLDLATAEGARGRYARVCIEVDITKPLIGKYLIDDKVLKIEYESLENMCFDCGFYGQKKETCSLNVEAQAKKPMETQTSNLEAVVEEQDTGEWMTVQRRNRRKPTKVDVHVRKPEPSKTSTASNLQ